MSLAASDVLAPTGFIESEFSGQHASICGVRWAAIVETVLALSALLVLDAVFGAGDRFISMTLHPFWIAVLIVTVQYGAAEALMAATLATVFLLANNLPEQSLNETMYDYIFRVSFTPFLWFVAALILGSIRSRQLHERKMLKEDLEEAKTAAQAVTEAYTAVKKSKDQLELRLAEERRSILTMYNLVKTLETIDPANKSVGIIQLVRIALNPVKFSYYRLKNGSLRLAFAQGWDDQDGYARLFEANTPLTYYIVRKKRILNVAAEEDELVLDGEGILAGPVYNEKSGEVFGMLKIEDTGFMDLGIRTRETFAVLCQWIADIYAKSELSLSD